MTAKDTITTGLSYLMQPSKRKFLREVWAIRNKSGLEIGGPSSIFGPRSPVPVYLFAGTVDDVNYDTSSTWGVAQRKGIFNYYGNKVGQQIITDGTRLDGITDSSYDFLLSSHSLEHIANPIAALMQWKRVLKPGGKIFLLLPDKRYTFDIHRAYTAFEHLVEDYENNTQESDTTHLAELLEHFEPARSVFRREEYAGFLADNFRFRYAHHHVFSQEVVKKMLSFAGFEVLEQGEFYELHLVTVARKR